MGTPVSFFILQKDIKKKRQNKKTNKQKQNKTWHYSNLRQNKSKTKNKTYTKKALKKLLFFHVSLVAHVYITFICVAALPPLGGAGDVWILNEVAHYTPKAGKRSNFYLKIGKMGDRVLWVLGFEVHFRGWDHSRFTPKNPGKSVLFLLFQYYLRFSGICVFIFTPLNPNKAMTEAQLKFQHEVTNKILL